MKTIWIVSLILLAGVTGRAQTVAGDWQGTLKAGPAELRIVLHITDGGQGAFKATMDSVDQGANGILVSSIELRDSKLKFAIDALHGTYEGNITGDGKAIDGTWSQGQPVPLRFTRAAAKPEAKPAQPSDIDGVWLGTLDAGPMRLRLAFHITNTSDGLKTTMDSLDQGAKGLPATAVTRSGAQLKIEMKGIGAKFEGKIAGGLDSIDGTFTQGGNDFPLTLKRSKDGVVSERRRPQDPVKPVPYRAEDVAYGNKSAGFQLAATLTLPPGKGPFPAAVLITGSGPQDRDESLMGHRPFLVLADHLTRRGIAVLRADDRGVGKSGGKFATATTADFATDAEAGIAYLKTRAEVDPRKIGLIGHSEGGIIGPLVAARNPGVAFVVMMAGPGVRGSELLVAQVQALAAAGGESKEKVEKAGAQEREILTLIEHDAGDDAVAQKLRSFVIKPIPEEHMATQIKQLRSAWFQYFLRFDPAPELAKVKCPVLAMFGEKDCQVPPKQNAPAVRKALEAGGNKSFEIDEFPGLNHLFQTAKTGLPKEYGEIEETIAPVALEKMSSWILKQTK